jgi:hypothetical protein
MSRLSTVKSRKRTGLKLAAIAAVLCVASVVAVNGADKKTETKDSETKAEKTADKKPEKKAVKKFTGPELYAMHCNRCHPERYPTEWTPGQWKTLMMHMRVRANLPAEQAKTILKYLQEESSGN